MAGLLGPVGISAKTVKQLVCCTCLSMLSLGSIDISLSLSSVDVCLVLYVVCLSVEKIRGGGACIKLLAQYGGFMQITRQNASRLR